jgi:hypothetical protein
VTGDGVALAQQRRTDHDNIRASHQEFHDVNRMMNVTCCREIDLSFPVPHQSPAGKTD